MLGLYWLTATDIVPPIMSAKQDQLTILGREEIFDISIFIESQIQTENERIPIVQTSKPRVELRYELE
jgi:hypothetical protein